MATILDYLKQQYGIPSDQPQVAGTGMTLAQLLGAPDLSGQSVSDPPPDPGIPQATPPPTPAPIAMGPALPAQSVAPVSAPKPMSIGDRLPAAMSDPGIARMLLSAGAALMQAGGPSDKPVGTGQALGAAINQGGGAFDQYRRTQLEQQAQKQAMAANQWQTLSPADAAKVFPGGVKPGYVVQRNGNGEVRQIGQDVFMNTSGYDANGYPISTPVDVRKLGQGGPAAAGSSANNTQRIAHLIATYQMAPLSSFAMGKPSGQAIMAAVAAENPSYNANNFTEYQKGFKDFGTGKQGSQVKSFGVAMSHLNTLDSLGDALDNGNVQAINKASNAVKSWFGGPAPTSFNAAKDVVSQEIIKAVTGAAGALGDRESAQKTLDAANSPAQLKAVIQTYKQLMAGQLQGLQRQFESSTGRNDFADAMKLPQDVVPMLGGPTPKASGMTYDPATGTFH